MSTGGIILHDDVEHVRVMAAFCWRVGQAYNSRIRKRLKASSIPRVDGLALIGDYVGLLQLGIKKCGNQVGRQVRGADVYPGVLVNFSTEKLGPICTLFSNNLRAFDEPWIVNNKCAALSAYKVFRFMETETPKVSDCTKVASIIRGVHALCRILYH